MPEIFPLLPPLNIDLTKDGDLEIRSEDRCLGIENNSLIFIPKLLIPYFMKRLIEIVGEE